MVWLLVASSVLLAGSFIESKTLVIFAMAYVIAIFQEIIPCTLLQIHNM